MPQYDPTRAIAASPTAGIPYGFVPQGPISTAQRAQQIQQPTYGAETQTLEAQRAAAARVAAGGAPGGGIAPPTTSYAPPGGGGAATEAARRAEASFQRGQDILSGAIQAAETGPIRQATREQLVGRITGERAPFTPQVVSGIRTDIMDRINQQAQQASLRTQQAAAARGVGGAPLESAARRITEAAALRAQGQATDLDVRSALENYQAISQAIGQGQQERQLVAGIQGPMQRQLSSELFGREFQAAIPPAYSGLGAPTASTQLGLTGQPGGGVAPAPAAPAGVPPAPVLGPLQDIGVPFAQPPLPTSTPLQALLGGDVTAPTGEPFPQMTEAEYQQNILAAQAAPTYQDYAAGQPAPAQTIDVSGVGAPGGQLQKRVTGRVSEITSDWMGVS